MTDLEQEALSHQHSHGVWVVKVEGGFAFFDHPNGKLRRIEICWVNGSLRPIVAYDALGEECERAQERWQSRQEVRKPGPQLDLPELNLDGIDL